MGLWGPGGQYSKPGNDLVVGMIGMSVHSIPSVRSTVPWRRYTMTEDDGLTIAYKEGQVRTTEFTLRGEAGGRAELGISVSGAFSESLGADFWCAGPLRMGLCVACLCANANWRAHAALARLRCASWCLRFPRSTVKCH